MLTSKVSSVSKNCLIHKQLKVEAKYMKINWMQNKLKILKCKWSAKGMIILEYK